MSELYNYEYYHNCCGPIPYEDPSHWVLFFGVIADCIVRDLKPKTVLDAGCAMGYLVAALRDRGVDAYGVDISEYAISKVREDVRPYCLTGSLTETLPDGLPKHYDLVVTIEVLEHLYAEDGKKAIQQLCTLSDCIIFSSTPDDFEEHTHFNVQQREYWSCLFAAEGFFDDLNYRPTYLTPYAVCYRRCNTWLRQVEDYERTLRINEAKLKKYDSNSCLALCRTQVFFDTGYGYREEESECRCYSYNEDFEFNISVGAKVKKLRVDPADEYAIVTIKKCCALCNEGLFDLDYQTNGIQVGNAILFDTADPQIWFSDFNKNLTEIRLILNVVRIIPDIVENYGRQYYLTQKTLQRNHELVQQHEEAKQKLVRQHEEAKQELIRQHEEQRRSLTQRCEALMQQSEEQRCGLTQQCEALRQQLALYQEHYHAAIAQREGLKQELARSQYAYSVVSNAFFWKITKPARVMTDALKSLLKKNRYTWLFCKGLKCWKQNGFSYTWRKIQNKVHYRQDYSKVGNPFRQEELERQKSDVFSQKIKFSILVPLYNTSEKFLREMIRSVLDQTYGDWELCLADGSDGQHREVEKICGQYARKDARIQYKRLKKNLGISENSNACIEMASGNYIALLDHDDLLHPAALHEVMRAICEQGADFIYTDEAIFHSTASDSFDFHLKSDYAPDTLRSVNYICHLTVFKRELMEESGEFRKECDGSQDFDLILRLTEKAKHIVHIPLVLYYWRAHPESTADSIGTKPYVINAGHRALQDHLQRAGLEGEVLDTVIPTMYRVRYKITGNPKISIIIPNHDHPDDLRTCLESIYSLSTYSNFEIIIVENGSKERELFSYYKELEEKKSNTHVISWEGSFNYAAINNFGVRHTSGEYIILLNNDTKVITPEWMEEMLMFSQRKDVGIVGAKLYYPDDTIQHAGIIIGIGSTAGHQHKGAHRNDYGFLGRLIYAQNLSAVTGACMMIRRDVWDEVGGLDEKFVVAFNDVDICLRVRKAGYLVVWTPYAELYHYESKSRGYEDTPEKQARFQREANLLQSRWAKELESGDPYYNPNLTLDREDFSLR